MNTYALINSVLYGTLSTDFKRPLKSAENEDYSGPLTWWSEVDSSDHTIDGYIKVSGVNPSSHDLNEDKVNSMKEFLSTSSITKILEMNPTFRVTITYQITDTFGEIVEEGQKIRIATYNELIVPNSIDVNNKLMYNVISQFDTVINLEAKPRGLGIKFQSSNNYRLTIKNITVSMSTTTKPVYDQYLITAQQNIGWPIESPTLEQISRYEVVVYDYLTMNPTNAITPIIPVTSYTPIRLHLNIYDMIFAYTYTPSEIDDILINNMRKSRTYKIETSVIGDGEADDDCIDNIAYEAPSEVTVLATDAITDDVVTVIINGESYTMSEIEWGESNVYSIESINAVISKLTGGVTISFTSVTTDYNVQVIMGEITTPTEI